MAEAIQYPKYHTFFHRQENDCINNLKCKHCGKEISEYKNCVCPQCGAYLGEEMYQEIEVLVEQVICGYVESYHEHEDGSISDEVFEERMNALEQVAEKVKESSKELSEHSESKYEATDKLGRFQNSLLYRITTGFFSLVYKLARPESEDDFYGIDLGYSIVFGIFGALLLFGATNAKGFGAVLLALISLLFILVPIVAIVERILGNKPNENEFLKRWTYWKHAVHSRLWVYFSKKTYQENELDEYYVSGVEDLVKYNKGLTKKLHDEDDIRLMVAVFTLMSLKILLIKDDYLRSKGEQGTDRIEEIQQRWRDLYEKYEA